MKIEDEVLIKLFGVCPPQEKNIPMFTYEQMILYGKFLSAAVNRKANKRIAELEEGITKVIDAYNQRED